MSADNRKYKRKVINLNVEYDISPHQIFTESRTRDIGSDGICLITREPMQQGKELFIKMFLPDGEKPLFIKGRVVWSSLHRENSSDVYLNGIQFFNINEHDRNLIDKFVDGATFKM